MCVAAPGASMDPTDIETVLVAGASGATGQELLRLLAPRVNTVRALTRSPGKRRDLRRAGADEVVVEDLLDPADLPGAVAGVDAVLSAVGSTVGGIRSPGPLVDGEGVRALLDAAVDAGVGAFVMESAVGVGDDPASPLATAFDVVLGPVQRAKAETETALRGADVRHTILRPGVLTNGPRTDDVTVAEPGAKLWGTVSRADVARLMIAAPVTEAAADRTLEVVGQPRFSGRRLSIDWQRPGRDHEDRHDGETIPVTSL
jgi:uncharacterized protein YbjT (DUF2867 family)